MEEDYPEQSVDIVEVEFNEYKFQIDNDDEDVTINVTAQTRAEALDKLARFVEKLSDIDSYTLPEDADDSSNNDHNIE